MYGTVLPGNPIFGVTLELLSRALRTPPLQAQATLKGKNRGKLQTSLPCPTPENKEKSPKNLPKKITKNGIFSVILGADFWAGDPTKHFSVKKVVFSEEGGGIQ